MKKLLKILILCSIFLSACGKKEYVPGTYVGEEKLYKSKIEVKLTLDEKKKIKNITALVHGKEEIITKEALLILVQEVNKTGSVKVDGIAGATYTSISFEKALKKALKKSGLKEEEIVKKNETLLKNKYEILNTDVIVAGGGGAGMVSASVVKELGKDVIILEKSKILGGNTARSTGGINASNTKYQKEEGIKDSKELFFKDTIIGGHKLNNKNLVRTLVENSNETIKWFDSIGAKFIDVGKMGGASVRRAHRPVDSKGLKLPIGTVMVEKLIAHCKKLNIKIITEAKVESLIISDGKVVGVRAMKSDGTRLTVNSKAVILAMGGFGANNKLVSKYRPELKGFITTNAPSITGDIVNIGEKIGISFIHMDQIQIHPTVRKEDGVLISESLRGDGGILVNYKGEHFIDELETRDVVSKAEISQKGSFAWLIVDKKMYDKSNVIKGYDEKGYFIKGKNVAELSKSIGTDYNILKKNLKLSNPPYYAVKVSPGIHHTMGGVKINSKAQVIDKNNNVIKGLFAAGEVTGGIHGANRLGGNALADLGTFGRIAGKNAVKEIKNTSF